MQPGPAARVSFDVTPLREWLVRHNRGQRAFYQLFVIALIVLALAFGTAAYIYGIALPKAVFLETVLAVVIALGLGAVAHFRAPPNLIVVGPDSVEFQAASQVQFSWSAGRALPTLRLLDRSGFPGSEGFKPYLQELRWGRNQLEVPLTPAAYSALVDWLRQHDVSLVERVGTVGLGVKYRELRHG
jgi:hypothetical protein